MGLIDFIPAGRTSLVDRGKNLYQIQTEYAYRPYARITTSIANNGQVVHKIEKKLEKPIESLDEQSKIEDRIKQQHLEVVGILRHNGSPVDKSKQEDITVVGTKEQIESNEYIETSDEPIEENQFFASNNQGYLTLIDRFTSIDGVKYVFQLNYKGYLISDDISSTVKKVYSSVFKNIRSLIDVFSTLPGETITREKGVYEIEREKLYLISAGENFYLIVMDRADPDINYEGYLKSIVDRFIV
jgi:hypothetical protein